MKKISTFFLFAVLITMAIPTLFAAANDVPNDEPVTDCTWSGASSTDWTDSSNWLGGCTPDTNVNVTIPGSAPNYPVITGNANVNDLLLEDGGELTVDNVMIKVKGNLTIQNGATLILTESEADLAKRTTPQDTNDDEEEQLDVKGTFVNEGAISQTRIVDSGLDGVDFINTAGYRGVNIYMEGGFDPQPITVVINGGQPCDTDNTTVNRCFDITPSDPDVTLNITFYYNPDELIEGRPDLTSCANLTVWRRSGTAWVPAADPDFDIHGCDDENLPYYVASWGIDAFSPFVLANIEPTAVTLGSFSVQSSTNLPFMFAAILLLALIATAAILLKRSSESR